MRPDPSTHFPTPLHLARTPHNPSLPWVENRCPPVIVRGVIFHQIHVEVECKVGNITKYNYLPGS